MENSKQMFFFIFVMVLWTNISLAHSTEKSFQKAANEKASSEITYSILENKIKETNDRIKASEAAENDHTAQQFGVLIFDMQARTTKLREILAAHQRLFTALKRQATLDKAMSLMRDKVKTQQQIGLSQKPPYFLGYYDQLLDQAATAEQEKETVQSEKRFVEKALQNTRSRLNEEEKILRSLKEQSKRTEELKNGTKLKWDLEQSRLNMELAQAIFDFQKMKLENLQAQLRLSELKTNLAQQSTTWVRSHLKFDQKDLDKKLHEFEKERSELQKRQSKLMREQKQVENAWLMAQKRESQAKNKNVRSVAASFLKTREVWRETYQRVLEQTEHMVHLLNQREQTWKKRYELIKAEADHEQLEVWLKDTGTQLNSIDAILALQQSHWTNLHSQIAALEKRISEEGVNPGIKQHLEEQLIAHRKSAERSLEYMAALLAAKEANRRLIDEIALVNEDIALWKKILVIGNTAKEVWNFELWVIDDQAVTVRKVVIALFIFVFGLFTVNYLMRVIKKRLLPRMNLEASAAAALEKIIYYLGFLLVILFGLHIVNIPLTAFTFLGGAIAIGVGFGAQNLINNFISGFIIMAERPISIGDLIEMEGNFAIVEEIGTRCTRIRTPANVHILVPNSSFLEKNITNWTLSDQLIRSNVTVGVVYGSPLREVKRLLIKAVSKHNKILLEPEPFVLFNDFGDNALVFNVYFWITMDRIMDRRTIESDVRFLIDDLFRQANIIIAFPQRDVHLDTTKPIEFRILNPNGGAAPVSGTAQ